MNFKTRWATCEEKNLYVPEGSWPKTQRQFVFWNYWRMFNRLIREYINKYELPNGQMKTLEIGCGRGTISHYLHHVFGARLTLVDNDQGSLAIAKEFFQDTNYATVTEADALSLPFPDNYYDLVFSTGLAEHLDTKDIEAFYKEQYRVLKPGGLMISLNIPHKFSIQVLNIFKKNDYVRSDIGPKQYSKSVVKVGFPYAEYCYVNPFPLFTNIPRFLERPITMFFLIIYFIRSLFMTDAFYGSEKWSQAHIIAAKKLI
jgi:SAM-dependent methyltransferase